MNKILLVFGTRPELIKLAPIVLEFQERNQRDRLFVINTAQHINLMKQNINAGIAKYIAKLLNNNRIINFNTIYGDGFASKRIADFLS